MRFKLLLDEDAEKELLHRSYYLGVPLSSIVLLHLVLYSEKATLTREDFREFTSKKHRSLQIDIKDYVIKKYDTKTRYSNSLSLFLSVYVSKLAELTEDDWKGSRHYEKTKTVFSTYRIEQDVIKEMNSVKGKTGLTYTTIINYAALLDVEPIDQLSLFDDESKTKKQQGFQLSPTVLEGVQADASTRNTTIGNLLEIKLKKALEILAL